VQRVFVHFGNNGVYAFDMDGTRPWHKEAGTQTNGFGSAGSPAIIDNKLIVNAEMTQIAKIVIREPGSQDNWNVSLVPDRDQLLARSPKTLYGIGPQGLARRCHRDTWEGASCNLCDRHQRLD
jgi:hypothetical protein